MPPTYASLRRPIFLSLYAATVSDDDFAESFASYVHVVLMQRPWPITIARDGLPAETFRACRGEPRCAEKQQLPEQSMRRAP